MTRQPKTETGAPDGRAPSGMTIGHVHLKVADIDRALGFYHDVLGLDIVTRQGDRMAFLSVDGYHHHIGLNTWESAGGTPPPAGHTGLFHVALLFPKRRDLALAARRVLDAGVTFDGAADHGVSEALYLNDPDGNGVELCWDRPRAEWPRDADGNAAPRSGRLDLRALLALAAPVDA